MRLELKRNSVAYEEMSQYIENIRRNRLMEKLKLFLILLAFLLHSGNDDYKHLARPERGQINCITVYLLGNDGAHSYNGNGILLTTTRRYTRLTNEELLDEIRPANLPLDVLQRQPTDREIGRMSGRIGQEYRLLAYELGLTRVQLDHLTLDCPTTLLRIERMFFIWRDEMEGNATFEILVNAMGMHGINTDIVNQSLERA
ncbi:uncharacterized protein LOC132752492 isoform X2 [Ruditapes philippinarum]|uniref:uncharacterized protein LOC132752492 isoform X2 n=1 Tax=Ruditapes philippinarum TaxID=129788 RepID=UPI00295A6A9B|nr:uncharacterized protein LOC132752492 isoform X2 [Ruditapes philippinarum]